MPCKRIDYVNGISYLLSSEAGGGGGGAIMSKLSGWPGLLTEVVGAPDGGGCDEWDIASCEGATDVCGSTVEGDDAAGGGADTVLIRCRGPCCKMSHKINISHIYFVNNVDIWREEHQIGSAITGML